MNNFSDQLMISDGSNSVITSAQDWTIGINPEYQAHQNSLTMIAGGTEMMRIAPDGFYVRGQRVPADDKEAETVYNAFKQFLVWAEMNRR